MIIGFTSVEECAASRMDVVPFTAGAMSCTSSWSVMPEVVGEAQWVMYWTALAAPVYVASARMPGK